MLMNVGNHIHENLELNLQSYQAYESIKQNVCTIYLYFGSSCEYSFCMFFFDKKKTRCQLNLMKARQGNLFKLCNNDGNEFFIKKTNHHKY